MISDILQIFCILCCAIGGEQTGCFLILLCQISVIMPISDKPVCGILAIGNCWNCWQKHKFLRQWNWLHREKKCPWGKEGGGGGGGGGGTSFSSTPNTHETYRACSHFAIAHQRRFLTFFLNIFWKYLNLRWLLGTFVFYSSFKSCFKIVHI